MELVIDRLTKQYENKIAVDCISIHLTKGVYGILGANGAGKTTLMRMLSGILKPTSGEIKFKYITSLLPKGMPIFNILLSLYCFWI